MKRVAGLFVAKANKVLDQMEDPRETLDYSYHEQLELLTRVLAGAANAALSRKRLESRMTTLRQQQAGLAGQAESAPNSGKGREALRRRSTIDRELSDLASRYEALQADEEQLRAASEPLKAKVDAFRVQKQIINAIYDAVETQARAGEVWARISKEAEQPDISTISHERQRELLTDLWCSAKEMAAARAHLDRQANILLQQQAELESQARRALDAGRDDAAQRAIAQKEEIDRRLPDLEANLHSLQADEERFATAYHQLAAIAEATGHRITSAEASLTAGDTADPRGEPGVGASEQTSAADAEAHEEPTEVEN